jgi:hypothetical protein
MEQERKNAPLPTLTQQIRLNKDRAAAVDLGRLVQALAMAKGNLSNAVLATRRWRIDAPRVAHALESMFQCQETLDDLAVKTAVGPGSTTDALWAGPNRLRD